MPVSHIAFNDTSSHGRLLRRALQLQEEGLNALRSVLATMATMIDGDGTSAAHFTYATAKFGFATTADAKAAWDELNSLAGKLTTDAAVTNVQAALRQAFNKFR